MRSRPRSYAHVAWCYDELASWWSRGAIPRAKAVVARALEQGDRVLFAGAGRGADALIAASRGVRVTALDAEPAMLRRLEQEQAARPSGRGGAVQCVCEDWFAYVPPRRYDAVVAAFALNVFAGEELDHALDVLTGWLRPGGHVWIVDFAPPARAFAARLRGGLHYWPVALAARWLGLCRLHAIHDYAPRLVERGFDLKEQHDAGPYRVWGAVLARPGARPSSAPQASPAGRQ